MLKSSFFCFILVFHLAFNQGFVKACEDEQEWCANLGEDYCETIQDMKKYCQLTCNSCFPEECSECEHACSTKDGGTHQCTCSEGYRLAANGRNCTDINECEKHLNPCPVDQKCRNYGGSYECLKDECVPFHDKDYVRSYSYPETCCKLTRGTCGKNLQNAVGERIINGTDARGGTWPWQALIIMQLNLCGGSLINNLWMVSAAHCFDRIKNVAKADISVYFGVTNMTQLDTPSHQKRKIVQVIRHEKYEFPRHDIALVKINKPVIPSDFVGPVCLPNGEIPADGTRCYTTGYGVVEVGTGRAADRLQQVDVPIVNGDVCRRSYEGVRDVDPEIMMCAGYEQGGKDACQGDSGGPLVCQRCDSCDWFLAGVTSFGEGCATPNFYGVYTNVEYYEKWIESKIRRIEIEKKKCQPIQWTNWGDWTECSENCGGGRQNRIRVCRNGIAGFPGCPGDDFESRVCNTQLCGVDSWEPWTKCSKTCDGGEQSRARICATASCRKRTQRKACNSQRCPTWRAWTSWGDCSRSCEGGEWFRTRSCRFGTIGQVGCEGPDRETQRCKEDVPCPKWQPWSEWTDCTKTCGSTGVQTSSRKCDDGFAGIDCPGESKRTRPCNRVACEGTFTQWSRWSPCTKNCGGGSQLRQRSCPVDSCKADKFGKETEQTKSCNNQECIGQWTNWSPWGTCDKTCGGGTRERIRTCRGGSKCPGKSQDAQTCNIDPCIGTWTRWSEWGTCSVTCGTGSRSRTRTCENGVNCPRSNRETGDCFPRACPVWGEWSNWSACSKTCEGGERSRTRVCGRGNEDEGLCPGNSTETEICGEGSCVVSCSDQCRGLVTQGMCRLQRPWMEVTCGPDCCGKQVCKDSFDTCANYELINCSTSGNFFINCIAFCGYCP